MQGSQADLVVAKEVMRGHLRQARQQLGEAARARASAAVASHADRWLAGLGAHRVGLYLAAGSEVDPAPLCRRLRARGVALCLPRCHVETRTLAFAAEVEDLPRAPGPRMVLGPAGVPEPTGPAVALVALDAVIMPCVGVDETGVRLGSGQGYYDRTLATYAGATAVLAFRCQRVAALPRAAHDLAVAWIVDEDGVSPAGAPR